MTLTELANLSKGQYGARYKVNDSTLLILINQLQQMAFAIDAEAFLVYSDLTVLQEVTMSASGYTNCVTADIGKTVTNGSVTGTLRYYNNTTRKWAIETSGTFSGSITISTGTGAGTFSSQTVYQGPYDWPSDIRSLIGVTALTDAQLYDEGTDTTNTDYGMNSDQDFWEREEYLKARNLQPARTWTAIEALSADTDYRWHGYRKSPTLSSLTDEDNFIIPEECHWEFFTALGKMCRDIFNGELTDFTQFEAMFRRLRKVWETRFTPDGTGNGYSEGQL